MVSRVDRLALQCGRQVRYRTFASLAHRFPRPRASISCAEVAQSVEHVTENHGVGSSILPLGTILIRIRPDVHSAPGDP